MRDELDLKPYPLGILFFVYLFGCFTYASCKIVFYLGSQVIEFLAYLGNTLASTL